ncbi:MAG: diphthine synthase [Candidatus Aenigmarchaeota archaeon]|nr:diphthine synthase [Candidatus Aenigmarchaeota archaeon]
MVTGKLSLISIGLFDESDLTLKGLEEAKKADRVFIELYTSKWHGNLKNLEKLVGKKVEILSRKDLEEESYKLLEQAKTRNIAIFVQGSALVQTTHLALLQEARKLNIKTRVVHNASIISAISETGLHPQKFGPYVTIPFPEKTKGKLPESVYEVIKMNKARGLHTLCLLDVEDSKCMTAKEGISILLELEDRRKEEVFTRATEVVVFAKAGSENPLIFYSRVEDILKMDLKEIPAVLIIPGILHFTEKEYLSLFKSEYNRKI